MENFCNYDQKLQPQILFDKFLFFHNFYMGCVISVKFPQTHITWEIRNKRENFHKLPILLHLSHSTLIEKSSFVCLSHSSHPWHGGLTEPLILWSLSLFTDYCCCLMKKKIQENYFSSSSIWFYLILPSKLTVKKWKGEIFFVNYNSFYCHR